MAINSPNRDEDMEATTIFILGVASHGAPGLMLSANEMRLLRTFLNNDGDTDGNAIDALAQKLDKYLSDQNFA